jgi:hypothetical protein
MADFIDLIIQFFRIDPAAAAKYAYAGPVYQIFFLLLLPSIFVILFIWMLISRGPISTHPGFKMLVAVAVYVFLILMPMGSNVSYYNWFVILGEFWIFMLIGIGVVYMVWTRGGTKSPAGQNGGQRASRGFFEGVGEGLANRVKKNITHEEQDMAVTIDSLLKAMEEIIHRFSAGGGDKDGLIRAWADMYGRITSMMSEYRNMISVNGLPVGGTKYKEFQDRLKKVSMKWDNLQK